MNASISDFPSEIQRRESDGRVYYRLPVHRHPQVQLGGGFLIFFGWALLYGVIPKLSGPLPVVLTLGSLAFLAGTALFAVGMWVCAGYDEIELAGHVLTRRMRVFCFTWSRRCPSTAIELLTVARVRETGLGTLTAELRSGKSFTVTYHYPAEWVAALAGDL